MRRPLSISIALAAAGLVIVAGWLLNGWSDGPPGQYGPMKAERFFMPDEGQPHAATWLQWPHERIAGTGTAKVSSPPGLP